MGGAPFSVWLCRSSVKDLQRVFSLLASRQNAEISSRAIRIYL
jgi:hypothetical protein